MNMIKTTRMRAGISQVKLAEYLGISKSLVYMAESSLRNLPSEAAKKLTLLEIGLKQQEKSTKSRQLQEWKEVEEKKHRENILYATRQSDECSYRIATLERKLRKIKEQYNKSVSAGNLQRAVTSAAGSSTGDKLWLDVVSANTAKNFANNCLATQSLIKLKLDAYKAEMNVYDGFLKKNGRKK